MVFWRKFSDHFGQTLYSANLYDIVMYTINYIRMYVSTKSKHHGSTAYLQKYFYDNIFVINFFVKFSDFFDYLYYEFGQILANFWFNNSIEHIDNRNW